MYEKLGPSRRPAGTHKMGRMVKPPSTTSCFRPDEATGSGASRSTPSQHDNRMDSSVWTQHERNIGKFLDDLGEDVNREGLVRTPKRFVKSMEFLTSGYQSNIEQIVNGALFKAEYQDMVIIQDIEFFSLCEHHLLPFYGTCHVGYIPDQKIIGLSKIPRIVNAMARRLQVQERLTADIAGALTSILKPLGLGVIVEAYHMCMMMRGVQKQNTTTITSHVEGIFAEQKTRDEFLRLVRMQSRG